MNPIKKVILCFLAWVFAFSLNVPAAKAAALTPDQVRAIAKEAYIYGFPIVDNYRVIYAYFVDRNNPEYKAPFNQIKNIPRVYTPADKAIQTPNSDTPYSMLGMDLRAEPLVLTVPAIEKDRYFSVQLIDLYTFNFDYIGSRTTGNGGGSFLVAGPNWKGETPAGIKKAFTSETELALAAYRTQLFNPGDLDNVKKVQAGYKVQTLSQFLGKPAPPPAPTIPFIPPLSPAEERSSAEFFNELAFALQFAPVNPTETALRKRFTQIGILPGKPFDTKSLSPEMKQAYVAGMADGQKEIDAEKAKGKSSADFFGRRAFLKNNYLYRAVAAQLGIYGNSKEEAYYFLFQKDAAGQPLEGNKRYTVSFKGGQLPPVHAFWSVTMYDLPAQLLVANPLNRYLINSPMLPQLKKESDGGLTLYIQNDSPGKDKEANWLPAPKGPFMLVLRLYWPKPAVLDGTWKAPAVTQVP